MTTEQRKRMRGNAPLVKLYSLVILALLVAEVKHGNKETVSPQTQ